MPAREDEEEREEAQGGLHSKSSPGPLSGEIGTSTFEGGKEGQTDLPSPHGKKRTASEDLEVEDPKRVKASMSAGSEDDVA